jgi:hypothetical protein
MKKKVTKELWYGSEIDKDGNPVYPPLAPSEERHLEGLNQGEVYIHNRDEDPKIIIVTDKGNVKEIGGDGEALEKKYIRKDQPDSTDFLLSANGGLVVRGGELIEETEDSLIEELEYGNTK